MSLERYRKLVPEWEAFREAATRPEPVVLRTCAERIHPEALQARLEEQGFSLTPLDPLPGFFRVEEGPHRISNTLEHWLGLFYVQQAVTGLAAPALAPRPGERVLDMCAAPGGKTTHAAQLMGGTGCVVAGDVSDRRHRALLGNLYRLGLANVAVVSVDGREFPAGARYDRVLVDAPCSAEGNLRGREGMLAEVSAGFLRHVTRLQEALLRRAIALTRPGGVVLYCTCTFSPDENEAVLDRVLADAPARVEAIEKLATAEGTRSAEGVPHAPGATGFQGREFAPELARAWRLYPHHLDSGGLFLARLQVEGEAPPNRESEEAGERAGAAGSAGGPASTRTGGSAGGAEAGEDYGWAPVPPVFPGDETGAREGEGRIEEALERLNGTFGIPLERLRELGWMVRGGSIWAHRCAEWPVEAWEARGDRRFLALGVRAVKDDKRLGLRPTNDFLRWMGSELRDRVLSLSAEECLELLEDGSMPTPEGLRGSVALEVDGWVVGRGVATARALRHEIPKGRASRLRTVLSIRSGAASVI